jgi:hypothetical protein
MKITTKNQKKIEFDKLSNNGKLDYVAALAFWPQSL